MKTSMCWSGHITKFVLKPICQLQKKKILITVVVLLQKKIKGSCQIPSHFWAGSDDFLASSSDLTLFEAVNMWRDFLEISWTLEISVFSLKYLLCKLAPCPQLGGVPLSPHRWHANSTSLASLAATCKTFQGRGCTLRPRTKFLTFAFYAHLL